MLTDKTSLTEQVAIPHEPGEWMRFRALSWRDLQAAQEARRAAVFEVAAKLPAEVIQNLQGQSPDEDEAGRYDKVSMLRSGIAEWSYGDSVRPETVDRLDQKTADWAFEEIVRRNVIMSAEGED